MRKSINLICMALLLILLCSCGGKAADEKSGFDVEFHRGGRDARPENTLPAYQYSLEQGASTIECDMQLTGDGEIVLSHDQVLNPELTTDENGDRIEAGKYDICDMDLDEIQRFNVGSIDKETEYYTLHGRTQVQTDAEIPTLRQLLQLIKDSGDKNIRLSIEAKSCPDPAMKEENETATDIDVLLDTFLELVKEFDFEDRVALQCYDWSVLVKMQKRDPDIETVALCNEQPEWGTPDSTTLWLDRDEPSPWLAGLDIHDFDGDPVKAASSLGIDAVSPYYEEIDKALVDEAHKLGMKIIPWTVNDPADMKKVYEMGVDGMITDRPWVLREFLESEGEKLLPEKKLDLPYHLEPDHIEAEEIEVEGGKDAAY